MHEVPPPITGTFMPTSYQFDLAETQATFASETYDFASCVSSPKTNDSFSTVDVKLLPKSDVKDPSLTNDLPSCSFKENVKPHRNLCNKSETADRIPCKNTFVRTKKCFVCGNKSHLIKDCNVHDTVDNFPFVVSKAAYVPAGSRNSSASISVGRYIPAGSRTKSAYIHADQSIPAASRNRSTSIHAGRSIPAASSNRPASIHADKHIPAGRINKLAPFPAGSSVPTGWTNPAARPFFKPTNLYFDNVYLHVNKDIGIVDSGCSRSMTGNKEKLDDFVQVKGGTITFGASLEESTKWHRRMAHVNFKTINKLAKHGLVKGLPLKLFTNEHNCIACNKGKKHKASYKAISAVRTISKPLQLLHMDLFGPTSIRSIDHKYYCLVVTDDFSRFCWAFFMGTKDETFYILKDFIALIENQLNKKVKAIRCDNGTEFRNAKLIALCGENGIKRDYKAVSTACYVLNRVSITNPHNKTPYELLSGKVYNIRHLKPFGCQMTILNTSDHLGKFKGNANDGFLVGYAVHSPMVHDVSAPMKNNLDYEEELARLQRQEYEAHSAAAKHGFEFSVDTVALLPQAKIEIRRNLVPAAGDPAGSIGSTGGVPAGSVPASCVPAGGVLAGSIVFTGGVPAG
nr:putative ribonuclease H-like domain-containing protein [Tanacetum cinerariifolium]